MLFIDAKITVSRSQHKAKTGIRVQFGCGIKTVGWPLVGSANANGSSISIIDYDEITCTSSRRRG